MLLKTRDQLTIRASSETESKLRQPVFIEIYNGISEGDNCLDQDDPELIKIMKKKYIKNPSKMPYKISDETKLKVEEGFGEYKQDKILDALLFQGKTLEGFFIEAGFIEIIICLSERCITSNLDG